MSATELKKIIIGVLILAISSPGALAEEFKMPKFSEGWNILPPEMSALMLKVLALVVACAIAIVLASMALGTGEVALGRMGKNTQHSAGGMDRMIRAVAGVIMFLAGVILVLWFVS